MTSVVVLADTHIRRGSRRRLPPAACRRLELEDGVVREHRILAV